MTKKEATKIYNKRKRENFIDYLRDSLPMIGIMSLVCIPAFAFLGWPFIIFWIVGSRFWEVFSCCWICFLFLSLIIGAIIIKIAQKVDERRQAIEYIMMRHNNDK